MKTPEELSKCLDGLQRKLESIQQLEDNLAEECEMNESLRDKIKRLESRLAQVERERDVMMPVFIKEMKKYGCTTCEHHIPAAYTQECLGCGNSKLLNWEWNGVCPENVKEGGDA